MRVLPVVLICRISRTCLVGQITGLCLRVPPARGALRDRHETWAGMRWMCRPRMTSVAGACGKTAWSCPPDAGVKFAKMICGRRWLQSPVHRGERGISLKPLRRECRIASAYLWSLPPAFFVAGGPWVQPAPGIPCALCLSRDDELAKLGQIMPRGCGPTSLRGAKRRSNPWYRKRRHGLLRFARNDGVGTVARAYRQHLSANPHTRLTRRNISPLAKAGPTGQEIIREAQKKRQRRTS
jgi:hypothetical protein